MSDDEWLAEMPMPQFNDKTNHTRGRVIITKTTPFLALLQTAENCTGPFIRRLEWNEKNTIHKNIHTWAHAEVLSINPIAHSRDRRFF